MKKTAKNEKNVKVVNGFTSTQNQNDFMMIESYVEEQKELAEKKKKASNGFTTSMPKSSKAEIPEIKAPVVESSEAQAIHARVSSQVVKDMYECFMAKPTAATVRFRDEDGCLVMRITFFYGKRLSRELSLFADTDLIGRTMRAMRGEQLEKLKAYCEEEHIIAATNVDPRIDIFRQCMKSTLKCRINADFLPDEADEDNRYISVSFIIAPKMEFRFCLERTSEIEEIVNETIKAA